MTRARLILLLVATTILAACGRGKKTMLPDSGGRPCEVVLTGDGDSILYKALAAITEPLPQPEPTLDISMAEGIGASLRLARNIIVVDINPKKYRQTEIRYERNVYAEPQMMVHIETPSKEKLRQDIAARSVAKAIASLLRRNEIGMVAERLQYKHNPKMEDVVKQMFGINMRLPADMTASRKGKDFIWISNDSPMAMTNICIYTSTNRDSVMAVNIKGETDAMHMATINSSVTLHTEQSSGHKIEVRRGLWEMTNDAMGGPFVSHTLKRCGNKPIIVVEAFVFAPGLKKRNLMLQTEAALYTIR